MKKINIAIDGYSSCGKSTLAKQLATHLNYIYIDSGAMYRAIALYSIEAGFYTNGQLNQNLLINSLPKIKIHFANTAEKNNTIFLNNKSVESEIRQMHVSEKVSTVAAIPAVRHKLVELQQQMASAKGVVMEGRDIGTNVIPNAELKLFMTASIEIRSKRRFEELKLKNQQVTFEEVQKNLSERDHLDTTRATNPLHQAADAIVIDNSNLSMQEQFDIALDLIMRKLNA